MALIVFDKARRRYAVTITLDPDEAENIADAFGPKDAAYRELYDAAAEARRRTERWRCQVTADPAIAAAKHAERNTP